MKSKLFSILAVVSSFSLSVASEAYDFTDSLDASKSHPGSDSIALANVPMFISLGFDDNGIADKKGKGGATWIYNYLHDKKNSVGSGNVSTFDGSSMRAAFYLTAKYGNEWVYEDFPAVRELWRKLYLDGHEMGNHSSFHIMKVEEEGPGNWVCTNFDGRAYTKKEWLEKEVAPCQELLTKPYSKKDVKLGIGIEKSDIKGWRTPRLEWNDSIFAVLKDEQFLYDCSMELEPEGNGTMFWWPHTLHKGSPAHNEVGKHSGLWEMPAYRFVIPPTLREQTGDSIMTGLDYNVWAPKDWDGKELTGPQFTEILKYTLDQRMKGNRAPLLIGLHSDMYASEKDSECPATGSARNRQKAIEDFIDYATQTYPEVRIVTPSQIIDWMRKPSGLIK